MTVSDDDIGMADLSLPSRETLQTKGQEAGADVVAVGSLFMIVTAEMKLSMAKVEVRLLDVRQGQYVLISPGSEVSSVARKSAPTAVSHALSETLSDIAMASEKPDTGPLHGPGVSRRATTNRLAR